eukprot:5237491-Lingulodinium_polyedra.AAC.1
MAPAPGIFVGLLTSNLSAFKPRKLQLRRYSAGKRLYSLKRPTGPPPLRLSGRAGYWRTPRSSTPWPGRGRIRACKAGPRSSCPP